MRIALFAADNVGCRIARFLQEQNEQPCCLVLDGHDSRGVNFEIAETLGVDSSKIIQTTRETRPQLADQLAAFQPDLCVLAWWPYILDVATLRVASIGSLNFHPSLLPHGRGKSPNFWSLVEGTPFGVTIHWVDENIDSGDIAFQSQIEVDWTDSGETLYQQSQDELVNLFAKHWPQIRVGQIPREAQPTQARCHMQSELDAASQIDLDKITTNRELLNLLRARTFPPHPGAWFESDGKRYEVRVSITEATDRNPISEIAAQHVALNTR
jgi:methionyl-tRNA formyltransferase